MKQPIHLHSGEAVHAHPNAALSMDLSLKSVFVLTGNRRHVGH